MPVEDVSDEGPVDIELPFTEVDYEYWNPPEANDLDDDDEEDEEDEEGS
jgi:hypothetical protein